MERGWGDPEAKIWAKAWKLDCLGCSWGERELPKTVGYRGTICWLRLESEIVLEQGTKVEHKLPNTVYCCIEAGSGLRIGSS